MHVSHPVFAYPSAFSRAIDAARAAPAAHVGGHAGAGGLQNHSLGSNYPIAVVAYGDDTFQVANLATGEARGGRWHTCAAASVVADGYAANLRRAAAARQLTPREEAEAAAERGEW